MNESRRINSTYRLQFTNNFRFSHAQALVPYLHDLGVSHLYASPVFAARPGSLSGYDTCDFSLINPELGGEAEFRELVRLLHQYEMGMIVDFVPNHMSAHPQWNRWWRHVLANGPSSPHSEFFDIDWYPFNSNLHGKVLLAILGKQYGEVLESGELRVDYRDGEFCLLYGDNNLPLNPRQIKVLLRHRWEEAAENIAIHPSIRQEYESILFQLDHIPNYRQVGIQARRDRERETNVATARLIDVIQKSPALQRHLQTVIEDFNGKPGQPESFDLLHALLEEQPYRLSYWRTAMQEINYRRFFDVNELIGLRMEYVPLFEAAHAKLISLADEGLIDGIRLDHIDGLLDPLQYLLNLRAATDQLERPLYLIVEKILARGEWLNPDWPIDGATGYQFLALLNGLWVDEKNLSEIERIYRRFRGQTQPDRDVIYTAKKLITTTSMASELNVLAHELNRLSEQDRRSRDFTLDGLQDALREVVACFPLYRTYISELGFSSTDESAIDEAIRQARRRNPSFDYSMFEFIRSHICPVRAEEESDEHFNQRLRFAMKFQQYTSPVQAKGMEDTVFYRHSPLASLNEVGSGSGRAPTTPQEFHDANMYRMRRWPDSMLTTATHDTKRGEDARMRIHVLTELPDEWRAHLLQWAQINERAKIYVNGQLAPDRADEYLYYQSLLGMWPPRGTTADEDTIQRMKSFMNKALKEAKVHTSWINPSNEYDAAMETFVEQTLRGGRAQEFLESFVPFAEKLAALAAWESVSQIALKLTSPGVIDTYQGGELWNLSLVDPDNRRPVDFNVRQHRLRALLQSVLSTDFSQEQRARTISELKKSWWSGDLKMFYLAAGLRFKQKEPELVSRGDYQPLTAIGPAETHLIAFMRQHNGKILCTVAVRWFASLLSAPDSLDDISEKLAKTFIEIPSLTHSPAGSNKPNADVEFENLLTGSKTRLTAGQEVLRFSAGDVLSGLPAAWLVANIAQSNGAQKRMES